MRWKGRRAALWDWPQRKWHTVSCPLAIGANSIASTRRIVWHWNNPWQADRFFTNAPNNGGIAWSFGTNPRIQYVVCATSSKLRCGIAAPFWSMLEQQIVSYNIWQWRGNQESSTGMLVLSARPNKNFYASSLTATTAPSHCFPDGLKEEHRKVVRLNLGLTIGGPRLVLTEKKCHIAVFIQLLNNQSSVRLWNDKFKLNLKPNKGQVQQDGHAAERCDGARLGLRSFHCLWANELRIFLHLGSSFALYQFLLESCSWARQNLPEVVPWMDLGDKFFVNFSDWASEVKPSKPMAHDLACTLLFQRNVQKNIFPMLGDNICPSAGCGCKQIIP